MAWEDVKPILRPEGVHMGIMKVDKDKCTSCGLCLQNCPFGAWEMDEGEAPRLKEKHDCFSCYNCIVVCPVDALSIQESYHVDKDIGNRSPVLSRPRCPWRPRIKMGIPTEWNAIEKAIFSRRSVRNFKEDPVPESYIRPGARGGPLRSQRRELPTLEVHRRHR